MVERPDCAPTGGVAPPPRPVPGVRRAPPARNRRHRAWLPSLRVSVPIPERRCGEPAFGHQRKGPRPRAFDNGEVPLNGKPFQGERRRAYRGPGGTALGRRAAPPAPNLGVEEEFLLVDPVTRRAVPRAALVLDDAGPQAHGSIQPELFPTQVETASRPVRTLAELRAELVRLRTGVADAAKANGCRVVGSGTPVLDAAEPPDVSPKERYRRVLREFGPLVDGQGVCGCHVHVEVPDPAEAVRVLGHLRPWLPVLQALAANSPFSDGHDTGYASWRSMVWAHWPAAGPTPLFDTPEEYDTAVRALVGTGAIYDQGMVYWHARRSLRYPTVEVRVADAAPTADAAVLLAALVRGLVARGLTEVRAGRPAPAVADHVLRAAHWRAARDGLEGRGADPATGRLRPAWQLVGRMVGWTRPALERHGDLPEVLALLGRLRTEGSPAGRQRAAYARRGAPADVVDALAATLLGEAVQPA